MDSDEGLIYVQGDILKESDMRQRKKKKKKMKEKDVHANANCNWIIEWMPTEIKSLQSDHGFWDNSVYERDPLLGLRCLSSACDME